MAPQDEIPRPPRALLAGFPDRYAVPPRPSGASAAAQDSHRQTGYLLSSELALFEKLMNLQLRVCAEQPKARGPHSAALFSFWSRSFTGLADACLLMSLGSYASCPPLVRGVIDCIAVQRSLIAEEFADYAELFPGAVFRQGAATGIDIGRYRASSVVVADPRLAETYRLVSDLAMPHFGGTLWLASSEASVQKVSVSFADSSFHLGWAQLVSGWLLQLAGVQLETALSALPDVRSDTRTDCEAAIRDTAPILFDARRCHSADVEGRFVIRNFRRSSSGQPKQIIFG
jgi:hypothetical protein